MELDQVATQVFFFQHGWQHNLRIDPPSLQHRHNVGLYDSTIFVLLV
jgi:hypothetical protein